jgi:hypothetical protein
VFAKIRNEERDLTDLFENQVYLCELYKSDSMNVGSCYHGMARPQVADGGTAFYMEGSCE